MSSLNFKLLPSPSKFATISSLILISALTSWAFLQAAGASPSRSVFIEPASSHPHRCGGESGAPLARPQESGGRGRAGACRLLRHPGICD